MNAILMLIVLTLGPAQQIDVGPGETLTIHDQGEGRPVVLLPGLAGCAYGYRKVIPPLQEAGLRTLVVEPLGFGSSARPPGADYSLTAQANRLARVLDERRVTDAIVVAHGVTASVALRLAYRRPDLVAAVCTIEGGPAESAASPTVDRSLQWARLIVKFGGRRVLRDKLRENLVESSGDPSWIDRRTLGRYLRNIDGDVEAFITTLSAMARTRETESLHDNLEKIDCPVRLLVGEADHASSIPDADIATMRARLADFAVEPVPGAGHFIFEEQPAAVVRAVLELRTREEESS
jgi:pimeloyl-ACP methyl ester carboxylesterase